LVGGAALLSLCIQASKVSSSWSDPSGMGSFTVTTIAGKQDKKKSFISAYIAVNKGSDIGIESMFAQQVTLYEQQCLSSKQIPKPFCPRQDEIKRLNREIMALQKQKHAIILMINANQTFLECYKDSVIKPYTVEWLKIEGGMTDPLVSLYGS